MVKWLTTAIFHPFFWIIFTPSSIVTDEMQVEAFNSLRCRNYYIVFVNCSLRIKSQTCSSPHFRPVVRVILSDDVCDFLSFCSRPFETKSTFAKTERKWSCMVGYQRPCKTSRAIYTWYKIKLAQYIRRRRIKNVGLRTVIN